MLKTTIDKPGKPKALTVLGILGGYINNPFWFLITTWKSNDAQPKN